jgi:tRNA wybutosine-synthesizing protein 3
VAALAAASGRTWTVRVEHMERVKWYAPRVRHLVADVRCTPATPAPVLAPAPTATPAVGRSRAAVTLRSEGEADNKLEGPALSDGAAVAGMEAAAAVGATSSHHPPPAAGKP